MAASFVIVVDPNGATTVEFVAEGCAIKDIGIGSRPVAGATRDYFVTCKGVEPEDCHMIIRSGNPIKFGAPLPKNASRSCVGACDSPFKCVESSGKLENGSDIFFCSCTALRAGITDPHTGHIEFIELAESEFPEPQSKHPRS